MSDPLVVSRRRVLALLAGGGLAAGGAGGLVGRALAPPSPAGTGEGAGATGSTTVSATSPPPATVAPVADRRLVVVELRGGNDGLATVVPLDDPRLVDLRPDLAPDPATLVDLDGHQGLHPGLGELARRWPLAVVAGVGARRPDGSHFEMRRRWWTGDPDGSAGLRSGFLGRVCDQLADGAPAGVAVGVPSPFLEAERPGSTTTVADADTLWFLHADDDWARALKSALPALAAGAPTRSVPDAGGDADAWRARARQGIVDLLDMADLAGTAEPDGTDDTGGYPDSDLGVRLALAARLLEADPDVRVVHVAFDGFDTHTAQAEIHPMLMDELGRGLVAFREHLDRLGLGPATLVATTSEFGRRPRQNGDGTDHGTAAPALLSGPVHPGVVGEAPRLDRLDDDGNLVATVDFDAYLALLGDAWLGVPASETLPGGPTPLPGVLVA